MSFYKHTDGEYEADIRVKGMRRLHVRLRTTKKSEAATRYAAVLALVREGDESLVTLLRTGETTIEEVTRYQRDQLPFADLRPALAWPTVHDAAHDYVQWIREHAEREHRTAAAAQFQLASFVERFGALRLDRVPLDGAAEWQAAVVTKSATNTARTIVGRVVALYNHHAKQEQRQAKQEQRPGRLLSCPLDPDTRPTRTTRRERFLDAAEADRLVAATPDALLAFVACGLLAGLRVGEVCHLRPGADIDLERQILVIQRRGEKGQPGYWTPKGGKRREVPISPRLRELLSRHLARYASDWYAFPSASRADAPQRPTWIAHVFQRVVQEAGLLPGRADPQGVVYHTLRHTFASRLVAADVNPYRVAKMLGNSLKMVETTYGHLAPTDNRAAVALLAESIAFPVLDEPEPTTSDDTVAADAVAEA